MPQNTIATLKDEGCLYLLLWRDIQDTFLSEKQNQEGECKMLS